MKPNQFKTRMMYFLAVKGYKGDSWCANRVVGKLVAYYYTRADAQYQPYYNPHFADITGYGRSNADRVQNRYFAGILAELKLKMNREPV